MHIHELVTMYKYNYWANERILQTAAQLSAEQFAAPTSHTYGSLHGTLVHTLGAEQAWRLRCHEGISPRSLLAATEVPTLADLRALWQDEEHKMRSFLATLQDENLSQAVHYRTTSGKDSSQLLWQILLHVLLHGMQHRSEAAAILTDFGQSPGDIDFIVFIRA